MNLGFFCPKMAVSWRTTVFQKLVCWNPYFYSVLEVPAFWAKLSKKAIFGHPPKKKEILTDNWKALFWVFLCFFTFCFFFLVFLVCFFCGFLFFVSFLFFVGGFKGQVRWPEGPPHLVLNPPYLLFVFCGFCCFCCFCFLCFFGGFKGQVMWPKGPPHLALNPPYLFIFVFVFVVFVPFLSLLLIEKPCFPPKKGIFVYFLCFPFFLPQPFLAFPFFCFSFSVSLLLLFFSFFLPCLSFFCFLLVPSFSLFLIFLSSLLLFSEKNNMQFLNCNFFHQYFLFFMVSCLVFSFKSLFLIFVFFLVFSYVFCWTSMFLVSKQTT